MRIAIFAFLLLGVFGGSAHAAVSKKQAQIRVPARTILVRATKEALDLPISNRLQALESQGEQGYRNLVSIMFDEKMPMETRWRAVTAAGRLGGKQATPEIERALGRSEWYMRNAGLVAMAGVDPESAARWARKLISDKALVVRTAAVETIAELKDHASAALLWQKLYAKENYRRGQSLFVRRHIVETLAVLEPVGSEGKFVEVLSDKDTSLHPLAIFALEQMTKQRFNESAPLPLQREHWQSWWKEKSRTANL
jgi:hypothetical protein